MVDGGLLMVDGLRVRADVEQAFQPAGSGGFPAASSSTELESSVNPQAGKAALQTGSQQEQ